jgi:hypothetical protein
MNSILYFYLFVRSCSGVPLPIYMDKELKIPVANPYVITLNNPTIPIIYTKSIATCIKYELRRIDK